MSTHNALSLVRLTNIVDGNSPIWFLDKNLQVRNSKPELTNDRFQCMENICHLRLTAKQNGSRNLWLQLLRLTVFFTMQTIERYIIGIHWVGYVLVNMFN